MSEILSMRGGVSAYVYDSASTRGNPEIFVLLHRSIEAIKSRAGNAKPEDKAGRASAIAEGYMLSAQLTTAFSEPSSSSCLANRHQKRLQLRKSSMLIILLQCDSACPNYLAEQSLVNLCSSHRPECFVHVGESNAMF